MKKDETRTEERQAEERKAAETGEELDDETLEDVAGGYDDAAFRRKFPFLHNDR